MTKILLIGAPISGNLGGPLILSATVKVLSRYFPNVEFTLLSGNPNDIELGETFGVRVISFTQKLDWYYISRKMLKEFKRTDIIIDIWGLVFSDSLTTSSMDGAWIGLPLLLGKLLGKPVIKYTADMGPFMERWNRFFAKFYLNKLDLIFARCETTRKYLLQIGITSPINVIPDTAFILEPIFKDNNTLPRNTLENNLIGLSVSYQVFRQAHDKENYINVMAKIADYIIYELDCHLVLIPNDVFPNTFDDVYVAKKVFRKINYKDKTTLLTKKYSAFELKGIIRKCGLLIGTRYHSIVAALSMCIPTIALGWHHKYHGVMKLMGLERYVYDINDLKFTDLRETIDYVWKNRDEINTKITSRMPYIKESVLSGGKFVKEFLDIWGLQE